MCASENLSSPQSRNWTKWLIVGLLGILILVGSAAILYLDERLVDLERETQRNITSLEWEIRSLERARNMDRILADMSESARLDPSSTEGFSTIESQYGTLTFAVTDVAPQADGSRVDLQVGNLTSATINGGTLALSYGPRETFAQTDESSELRETTYSFKEDLESGAWNNITVTLPGTPPEELGRLEISIDEMSSISLRTW